MINGRILNREALLPLEVSGPAQSTQRIEAVIDTGYNGYLTFPGSLVSTLQLTHAGYRRGMLADGSVIRLDVYLAKNDWHGRSQDVLVLQMEGSALLGMSLLSGNKMTMDVIEGGLVTLEELVSSP